MTLNDFIKKYDDTYLDYDGIYGFQCKDLFSAYNNEIVGADYIYGDAYKLYDNAPKSVYEKVGTPQAGDAIVWGRGIGPYGHVAVFVEGDTSAFISFDQNYPIGSPCHLQRHNYNNIIGYLRPRKELTMPEPCFISEDFANKFTREFVNYWFDILYGVKLTEAQKQDWVKWIVYNNMRFADFVEEQVRTDFFKYFVRRVDYQKIYEENQKLKQDLADRQQSDCQARMDEIRRIVG